MKKIVIALVAVMTMSLSVMAQDTTRVRRDFPRQSVEEMAKQRTDDAVKKYGLNEEQAQKLLDLNTRYFQKMGPMMMGGPRRGQGGPRPQMGERPQRPEGDTVQHQRRPRPEFGGNREEMRKNREAYDTELKTILTDEQYKAYQKDEQSRRQGRGNRGPRGQRPQNG